MHTSFYFSDLLHNKSEPISNTLTESLLNQFRRERQSRRRRKLKAQRKRKRKRKKKKRSRGGKEKKKSDRVSNKKHSETRKGIRRGRKRVVIVHKKLRPSLPDVTTNQISVLMDADA